MKFGKLNDISKIDFSIPETAAESMALLQKDNKSEPENGLKSESQPEIFIGCPAWGNKTWVNKIYPPRTPATRFLQHYVQNFNTVELNSTHYAIPQSTTIAKWRETALQINQANTKKKSKEKRINKFKFCPKFHQAISHHNQLVNCRDWIENFYTTIALFEDTLGMPFLQLAPDFGPQKLSTLEFFLKDKSQKLPIAIEVRNPYFFNSEKNKKDLFDLLQNYGATAVMTDTAGRRDVLHNRLTTKTSFIRFVGNNLHPTDYERIDNWVLKLKDWIENGLEKLFFFVHEPEEVNCPEMVLYFVKKLNQACNLNIKPPVFIEKVEQGTLF